MGDIIEFTSWSNQKNLFYRITSNCINFDVKSRGVAVVGLTSEANCHSQCPVLVIIGNRDQLSIKVVNDNEKSHKEAALIEPNLINGNQYTRLWISWVENAIELGRYGSNEPLLQCKTSNLSQLKFVTFLVSGNNDHPVHWRFELPPILKKPSLKPISKGELKWVTSETQLPDNAVIGGFDNEILYIIRAKHRSSLTPGAFVPSEGCGYIPWGGESHEKTKFDVLCGINCIWVPAEGDKIPKGAFQAGFSEVNNEPLYIGRVLYNGSVIPGKVQPSHRVCYIPSNGQEKPAQKYEILVVPDDYSQNSTKSFNHINVADYEGDRSEESSLEDDFLYPDYEGHDDYEEYDPRYMYE